MRFQSRFFPSKPLFVESLMIRSFLVLTNVVDIAFDDVKALGDAAIDWVVALLGAVARR